MQKLQRLRIYSLKPFSSLPLLHSNPPSNSLFSTFSIPSRIFSNVLPPEYNSLPSRTFSNLLQPSRAFSSINDSHTPAPIHYRSMLQEDEFHRLADSTIHHLLEKLEEYGDTIDIDGFDVDYGNEVLTLKLGDLGTYVVNKQTPNRQIWLSSPVSGPSRYDWDPSSQAWVYRRNKENLFGCLERELEQLCGESLSLS